MLSFKQFLVEGNKFSRILNNQKNQRYIFIMSVEKGPRFFYNENDTEADKKKIDKQVQELNKKNTTNFRRELTAKKIGYIPVKGAYFEQTKDTKVMVYETSNIITATDFWPTYKLVKHWAIKTQQDTILIASDSEGVLEYTRDFIDDEGNKHSIGDIVHIGHINLRKVGDIFTLLKNGKEFSFSDDTVSKKVIRFFNK